jgi:hypothetical protein
MYILTQTEPLKNCQNNEYWVDAGEIGKQYQANGYKQYERRYKLKERNKEYNIICAEYKKLEKNYETIVIIPDFLVPRRPYPLYVYLHGINLYSNAPEKGQRWAAEATRKFFGLDKFSHSTLGRALKALARSIAITAPCDSRDAEAETTNEPRANMFPTVATTAMRRKLAKDFLSNTIQWMQASRVIGDCLCMARRLFAQHNRFLL